jgi:NAD(P)-dependent dehydrogenase (short-subunit alcohol dehydrogenase family)
LARYLGHGAKAFGADLAKADQAARLFKDVLAAYGRVDTLVNNAGVWRTSRFAKPIRAWTKDWLYTMDVNLTSAAVLSREAIVHFKTRGGGRIIHVASRAAFRGETPDYFAYAAAKGGMVSLSRSIARMFGKDNVKSFIVAPGYVETEMVRTYLKTHGRAGVMSEIALKELTKPGDVAALIVLLASGLMDHTTGCSIDINAGSYVH